MKTLESEGSGFIVSPDGYILSNWHVVAGAYDIVVTFADGSQTKAEVANAARIIDLAILKVKTDKPLQAITWADSDTVQLGDTVFAIGNALGIGISVSRGVVSALHRNIHDTPFDDFIQTDAAINHGNSGGPMFNVHGEVVGVDSALISPTSGSVGLGFALPSNQARFVLKQLKEYGWVRPGWLGVTIQDVTDDMATTMGIQGRGAIIAWITPGGPAERDGLRVGDVINRFEEAHPDNERALLRAIAGSPPGRVVHLGGYRDGKPLELTVTLGEWPRMAWEQANAPLKPAVPHWKVPADLGLHLAELTDQWRADNKSLDGHSGVLVNEVLPGTDAALRGVQAGDVILQVENAAVGSQDSFLERVAALRNAGRGTAMFLVYPKGEGDKPYPTPKWMPLRVAE